jgi:hypothetical protein
MTELKKYRKRFLKTLQEKGLGPGSLLKYPYSYWRHDHGHIVALVTGVCWENVSQKLDLMDLDGYRGLVRSSEQSLLRVRIVKSDVPESAAGWHGPPVPGSAAYLSPRQCITLLPEVLGSTQADDSSPKSEILSKAPTIAPPEGFLSPEELPTGLVRSYAFERIRGERIKRLSHETFYTRKLFRALDPVEYDKTWPEIKQGEL